MTVSRKLLLLLPVLLVALFGLAACGSDDPTPTATQAAAVSDPTPTSRPIYTVRWMAGTLESQSGFMAVATADIVNRESDWVRLEVEPSAGNEGNIFYVNEPQERAKFIVNGVQFIGDMAQAGIGSFPPNTDPPLALFHTSEGGVAIYTDDPEILTIRDLAGKRVDPFAPGHPINTIIMAALEACGVADKIKISNLGRGANDALAAGTVDAVVTGLIAGLVDGEIRNGATPSPGVQQVMQTQKVYVVGMPVECIEEAKEASGLTTFPLCFAPNTMNKFLSLDYDPIREPGCTTAYTPGAYASADLPDDVAYEIVRLAIKHVNEYADYHIAGYLMERMGYVYTDLDGIHPGARRAYEEAGMAYGAPPVAEQPK